MKGKHIISPYLLSMFTIASLLNSFVFPVILEIFRTEYVALNSGQANIALVLLLCSAWNTLSRAAMPDTAISSQPSQDSSQNNVFFLRIICNRWIRIIYLNYSCEIDDMWRVDVTLRHVTWAWHSMFTLAYWLVGGLLACQTSLITHKCARATSRHTTQPYY